MLENKHTSCLSEWTELSDKLTGFHGNFSMKNFSWTKNTFHFDLSTSRLLVDDDEHLLQMTLGGIPMKVLKGLKSLMLIADNF
jgi:hypothetical protein